MEQFAQRNEGVLRRDRARVVDRAITEILDDLRLGDEPMADDRAKRRLVDQRGQRLVVGRAQRLVALVHPFDRRLQRESCVKAGGARIGQRNVFGRAGVLEDFGKFGLEKSKLAH